MKHSAPHPSECFLHGAPGEREIAQFVKSVITWVADEIRDTDIPFYRGSAVRMIRALRREYETIDASARGKPPGYKGVREEGGRFIGGEVKNA